MDVGFGLGLGAGEMGETGRMFEWSSDDPQGYLHRDLAVSRPWEPTADNTACDLADTVLDLVLMIQIDRWRYTQSGTDRGGLGWSIQGGRTERNFRWSKISSRNTS